jgi:hypothetical protein
MYFILTLWLFQKDVFYPFIKKTSDLLLKKIKIKINIQESMQLGLFLVEVPLSLEI